MKFIHAADLHLDSPMRGLERYEGAPATQLRGATRQSFENLVQFAVNEGVDFIVIAGDVYDGDWTDYSTGLFFARQMTVLRKEGIKVFLVRGNHDAASQITRQLTLPDNVHEFSAQKPETVVLDDLGVASTGRASPRAPSRKTFRQRTHWPKSNSSISEYYTRAQMAVKAMRTMPHAPSLA